MMLRREALSELNALLRNLDRRIKQDVELPAQRIERAARRIEGSLERRELVADPGFRRHADELLVSGRTLLGYDRLAVLWQAARNTAALNLPAVEVGVFRGGSAAFLARAFAAAGAPDLPIYAYDTFMGHPAAAISDADPHHKPGMFADTSFEDVREYLTPFRGVEVRPGVFPGAAAELPEGDFALAHVDTDLYEPTLGTLRFFAGRMPAGAVIVVDDYGAGKVAGVLKAVSEFLAAGAPFHQWHFGTEQAVLVRRG